MQICVIKTQSLIRLIELHSISNFSDKLDLLITFILKSGFLLRIFYLEKLSAEFDSFFKLLFFRYDTSSTMIILSKTPVEYDTSLIDVVAWNSAKAFDLNAKK